VRLTKIAKDAYVEVRSAQPTDIRLLSGRSQKPTISELKEVLNLRHYVSYLQHGLFLSENVKTLFNDEAEFLTDLTAQDHSTLVQNFHRSLYHYFIAGAVLSREFLKPMYDAKEQNLRTQQCSDPYFMGITNKIEMQGGDWDTVIRDLDAYDWSEEEKSFMNSYPAYHFTESERWEECFGSLTKWLVEDAKKRNKGREGENLRDLLRLLFVFGQMIDGGVLGGGGKPFWDLTREGCTCAAQQQKAAEEYAARNGEDDSEQGEDNFDENVLCIGPNRWHHKGKYYPIEDVDPTCYDVANAKESNARMSAEDSRGQDSWKVTTRKVDLIDLSVFTPVKMSLTSGPEFTKHTCFRKQAVEIDYTKHPNPPIIPEMAEFLDILHCMTDIPNHIETSIPNELHFAPHPPLHFFTYMLREYYGYQFADDAFEVKGTVGTYEAFIGDARILGRGEGCWDALLVSKDMKLRFVYEERKFSECVAPPGGW